ALGCQRLVELRDLVALGQVGIEVVLARENAGLVHLATERQRRARGQGDGPLVGHRQRARKPEADRADVRVRRGAEAGGAAAEHLGAGEELDVHLEPDDGLPGHQRTSRLASRAASSAPATASIGPSENIGPTSWAPMGRPSDRPTGRLRAGSAARLMEQVKMSARYIATGSAVFAPALKAGVGVVGVSR